MRRTALCCTNVIITIFLLQYNTLMIIWLSETSTTIILPDRLEVMRSTEQQAYGKANKLLTMKLTFQKPKFHLKKWLRQLQGCQRSINHTVYRIIDHVQHYSSLLICDILHSDVIIINTMSSRKIALDFYKNATPDFIKKLSYKEDCKYDSFSLFLDEKDTIDFQWVISLLKQSLRLKDEKIAQETLAIYKKNETIAQQTQAIITLNKAIILYNQHIDELNLTIAHQRQSIINHKQTLAYRQQVVIARQTPFFLIRQFLLGYFFSLIVLTPITLLLGWTKYNRDRKAISYPAPFFIAVIYVIIWVVLTLTSIGLTIKRRKESNRIIGSKSE